MTHQAPPSSAPSGADPGQQIAQLREALRLVEQIAGVEGHGDSQEARLDEAARISIAYDGALPVVQRRFETLIAETTDWTAAGVEALLVAAQSGPPKAAAARLAVQLERALSELILIETLVLGIGPR